MKVLCIKEFRRHSGTLALVKGKIYSKRGSIIKKCEDNGEFVCPDSDYSREFLLFGKK